MKKVISYLMIICLAGVLLTACGGTSENTDTGITEAVAEKNDDSITKPTDTTTQTTAETTVTTTPANPDDLVDLELPIEINTNTYNGYTGYYINNDGILYDYYGTVVAEDVRYFAASIDYSDAYFYIKNDNSLWGFGSNELAQLGDNTGVDKPEYADAVKILDDVANLYIYNDGLPSVVITALKNDGTLWVWGSDNEDRVMNIDTNLLFVASHENSPIVYAPVQIAENVVNVLSKDYFQKSDGSIWTYNYMDNDGFYSQSNFLQETTAYPAVVEGNIVKVGANIKDFTSINSGGDFVTHIYALRGDNALYEYFTDEPGVVVNKTDGVKRIFTYEYNSVLFYIDENDNLYGKGKNTDGLLGDGSLIDRKDFVKIGENVKDVGEYYYITNDNKLFTWNEENPTPKEHTLSICYMENRYGISPDGDVYSFNYNDWNEYEIVLSGVKLP
jgi:alpha-tubulin suppressor-like RCC1 family protein